MPWGPWPKNKSLKYIGSIQAEIMTTGAEAYGMQVSGIESEFQPVNN